MVTTMWQREFFLFCVSKHINERTERYAINLNLPNKLMTKGQVLIGVVIVVVIKC